MDHISFTKFYLLIWLLFFILFLLPNNISNEQLDANKTKHSNGTILENGNYTRNTGTFYRHPVRPLPRPRPRPVMINPRRARLNVNKTKHSNGTILENGNYTSTNNTKRFYGHPVRPVYHAIAYIKCEKNFVNVRGICKEKIKTISDNGGNYTRNMSLNFYPTSYLRPTMMRPRCAKNFISVRGVCKEKIETVSDNSGN